MYQDRSILRGLRYQRNFKEVAGTPSETGVPNLFLTMYPFSFPTNEHVPLEHFNS